MVAIQIITTTTWNGFHKSIERKKRMDQMSMQKNNNSLKRNFSIKLKLKLIAIVQFALFESCVLNAF